MDFKKFKELFIKDEEPVDEPGDGGDDPEAEQKNIRPGSFITATPSNQPMRTLTPPPAGEQGVKPADPQMPFPVPILPDGTLNLADIYQRFGVPERAYTAEWALDMLENLSEVTTVEKKRRSVTGILKAIKHNEATPEAVAADAADKLSALTEFSSGLAEETAKFVAAKEAMIAELKAQVEQHCEDIKQAEARRKLATKQCETEYARLEGVVEFLGVDAPPR